MMGHHRQDDPPGAMYRVTREVPLTWLIGFAIAGVFQAGLLYYKQDAQSILVTSLREDIRALSISVSSKDLKDVEHDLKIADLQRRISLLEARK